MSDQPSKLEELQTRANGGRPVGKIHTLKRGRITYTLREGVAPDYWELTRKCSDRQVEVYFPEELIEMVVAARVEAAVQRAMAALVKTALGKK